MADEGNADDAMVAAAVAVVDVAGSDGTASVTELDDASLDGLWPPTSRPSWPS